MATKPHLLLLWVLAWLLLFVAGSASALSGTFKQAIELHLCDAVTREYDAVDTGGGDPQEGAIGHEGPYDAVMLLCVGVVESGAEPGLQNVPRGAAGAESAFQGAQLRTHLRLQAEYGQAGVRELANGRFRYYGELRPPRTAGEMIGQRTVREWDPATGLERTWLETVDAAGNVRIVRPETGGPKVHHLFDAEGNYVGQR